MKPEWKEFLADAGAEFDDGCVATFGNPERERRMTTTGLVFCDLSHFGMIAAYGADAESFLQNQLTNDVRKVDAGHSQLNAYCTPKGRMLAFFRLFRRGDTYYLRMPREVTEPTLERLRKFVLMSKVTLEDGSDALVRIGVSGTAAPEELTAALGKVPQGPEDVVTAGDITAIRVPGVLPRFEIYGELEAMKSLWNKLNVRGAPIGAPNWKLLDILAGIPNVYTETQEAFVPQMANLELIDGVSFKKGCYPGQEIVARMQYLGKLKRRMYRLHGGGSQPPAPGTDIFLAGKAEEPVGKVVDAELHPDGGFDLLGVIQIDAAEQGELHLTAVDGPAVSVQTLPYPLEKAS